MPDIKKTIKVEYLGPGETLEIEFSKPKLKHLVELQGLTGVVYDRKLCMSCIKAKGKVQPEEWWDEMDYDVYNEVLLFVQSHLPKKKKQGPLD